MVIPRIVCRVVRRWAAGGGLLLLALTACRSERASLGALRSEASVVTQVQMVRPAAERVANAASGVSSGTVVARGVALAGAADVQAQRPEPDAIDEAHVYCRHVEQQARETQAGLPKRLDRDTSATRAVAYGCDVVLEYVMHDLRVEDVAAAGVSALRAAVVEKLCSDRGARGVMDHGGSFTNVYRDQHSSLIDQFTIAAEECTEPLPADGAPASLEL